MRRLKRGQVAAESLQLFFVTVIILTIIVIFVAFSHFIKILANDPVGAQPVPSFTGEHDIDTNVLAYMFLFEDSFSHPPVCSVGATTVVLRAPCSCGEDICNSGESCDMERGVCNGGS